VPLAVDAGLFFAEADSDGRVAEMPAGVDPDEFVRAQGAEAFRALVAQARPMLDHLIQRAADDATIPGKAATVKRVAEVLGKVRNPLVRDLYVRDLAAKLAVPVAQVMRLVREATSHAPRAEATAPLTPAEVGPVRRTPQSDELDALALLVAQPKLAASPEAQQIYDLLRDPGIREIYGAALVTMRASGRADVPAWLDSGPTDIRDQVSAALMDGRWAALEATDDAMRAMRALVLKLDRLRVDSELALAQRQYREALARGNEEEARAISMREMELIRTKLGLANQSKGMTT
jgi:DNA primase